MRTPQLDKVQQDNELILPPGNYAYMQEATGGQVKINVGPCVVNKSAQEFPVTYQHRKGFGRVGSMSDAIASSPIAVQGYYLQLYNPTEDFDQHNPNKSQPNRGLDGKVAPNLDVGRKVNIAGPVSFALWPGQHAEVIRGHHLRSNQYLFVRVYDEVEARKHWDQAIMLKQKAVSEQTKEPELDDEGNPIPGEATTDSDQIVSDASMPEDLSVGKILLVRGTEVSFFIPPTGVAVMQEENGEFVREALSLERLDYCILVDENGNKRYERGPQVVFPKPTEHFITDSRARRQFRALELNDIQGIYLKVIADYKEEDGTRRVAGDEVFITGKQQKIYYPREEHAIVKYDNNAKHYATAIPKGEARYSLDRMNGNINNLVGPDMVLLDPRQKVFVRRALTEDQCKLWYPGNKEVMQYNEELRGLQGATAGTRGAITDGEYSRSGVAKRTSTRSGKGHRQTTDDVMMGDRALLGERSDQGISGDEIARRATYTEPRTIELGGKFDRVPVIKPWIGYAAKIVSNTGGSRIVQHPNAALLDYDETLEILTMSSGLKKSTENCKKVAYLRVHNNKVSDVVTIETQDHVTLNLRLSYLVNFRGSPDRWFSIENYVQHLTDHIRSVLKGAARGVKVGELYNNIHVFVRDTILGETPEEGTRRGMVFEGNGMVVDDVDVLTTEFTERRFADLLGQSQEKIVAGNIQIADAQHANTVELALHMVQREKAEINDTTAAARHRLALQSIARELIEKVHALEAQKKEALEAIEIEKISQVRADTTFAAGLTREKAKFDQANEQATIAHARNLEALAAETAATVDRLSKAMPGFSEALQSMTRDDTAVRVANAMSVQTMIGGQNLVETVQGMFGNTRLGTFLKAAVQPNEEPRPNG